MEKVKEFLGFSLTEFDFESTTGFVVMPKTKQNGRIAFKTEYWDAFPKAEIKLLEEGFYLCYIENNNRWGTDEDLDRKYDNIFNN